MKTKILAIALSGISFGLNAQNVDLSNSTDYIRIQKNGESGFTRAFGLNSSNHMYIGSVEKTIGNIYFFNKGTNHLMTINPNGNVGIRTNSPTATLHINSNSDVGRGQNPALRIGFRNGNHIAIDDNEIGAFNNNSNAPLYINGSQSTSNTIINGDGTGNVGIGTTNPGSWKLAVNGKIRAKEIKVETVWSDFVFEENYKLPTIEEVENYIKDKGHLKDIPSAEEVAENGIYLGEMNSKLLQKIEELTLYTIQQEKKLKEQFQRLEEQNSKFQKQEIEIEDLKKQNSKLENILSRLEKLESK